MFRVFHFIYSSFLARARFMRSSVSMPLAALLLLAIARTALCACSVPGPIAVPITDLPLSNGETRRGVALSIGTPAQNFSVIPSG